MPPPSGPAPLALPDTSRRAERPLAGVTLLAVEDSRFTCDALRLLCQRNGARLRRAETLAAAQAHLRLYRPDARLMTRERYTSHEKLSQGAVTLDGSENASVQYAHCCRPVPGDSIVGYLGRGEGLVVHNTHCSVAKRLQHKDSECFIAVDWSDEPSYRKME